MSEHYCLSLTNIKTIRYDSKTSKKGDTEER